MSEKKEDVKPGYVFGIGSTGAWVIFIVALAVAYAINTVGHAAKMNPQVVLAFLGFCLVVKYLLIQREENTPPKDTPPKDKH